MLFLIIFSSSSRLWFRPFLDFKACKMVVAKLAVRRFETLSQSYAQSARAAFAAFRSFMAPETEGHFRSFMARMRAKVLSQFYGSS